MEIHLKFNSQTTRNIYNSLTLFIHNNVATATTILQTWQERRLCYKRGKRDDYVTNMEIEMTTWK
jgi:hypothetical protein